MAPLGITGSTGNLGGRVARLLADAGTEQRLLCRDPSRAPSLAGAEPVAPPYDGRWRGSTRC
jgi:NAD(P)H dehydrogenase (quinone)